MIDVTMRAEDDVHRLRLDARLRQAAEKAVPLAPMELPNKRTLLLLTDATVDQDRSLSCAKRKGLIAKGSCPRAQSKWSGSSKERADSCPPRSRGGSW